MKYIKRVLPLLLAALILFGGIYGGYALRAAIPSYKGTIVEAEKKSERKPSASDRQRRNHHLFPLGSI